MSSQPDRTVLILAVAALFGFYFLWVGGALFGYARRLVETVQNWP